MDDTKRAAEALRREARTLRGRIDICKDDRTRAALWNLADRKDAAAAVLEAKGEA
ncbi:hypothetical protein RQ734_15290 [Roseomonas mucosa]|uniref:hypothetical protein n=1 Tax=Roseomonas mucosa TaxID=207340 RepID=UPI0028CC6FC1|nr:hypothetical protein [Roseomonas mucosa]MDT8277436.1 hypothetical protein [Roseomonas mucosa]